MQQEKYLVFDTKTTLFVGGLPITATEQDLIDYFSQFDQNVQIKIKKKRAQDIVNLGYAYLVSSPAAKDRIFAQKFHSIAGRQIECSQYLPKGRKRNKHLLDQQQRKLFVKGLRGDRQIKAIREFFSRFGRLQNCYHRHSEDGQVMKQEVCLVYETSKATERVEALARDGELWMDGTVPSSRSSGARSTCPTRSSARLPKRARGLKTQPEIQKNPEIRRGSQEGRRPQRTASTSLTFAHRDPGLRGQS